MDRDSPADTFGSMARGLAQSGIRIANERAVMTLIALNPGASNADLARLSGLGPQTTSRIVVDLETRDLITRGQVLRGRRGQPATPLFINPDGAFTIGIDIGWRHVEVLLFSMSGKVHASVRRSYPWPDANAIVTLVAAEVATIRAGMTPVQASRLMGLGLASPSNMERNVVRLGAPQAQAEMWSGYDLVGRLHRTTGLPVQWFNDGNAGCWSELIAHARPRPDGMAYIQVGTLLGAGIVIGGDLWEGRTGNGANLGSVMVTDAAGEPSYAHLVASIFALEQRLLAVGKALPSGNPLNWDWAALEPVASEWLDAAGHAVAQAIISTMGVVELDKTIVDGGMPRLGVERLVQRVRHHLDTLPSLSPTRPCIGMGQNGASAAARGAAGLVLFHLYFSRAWNIFSA